MSTQELKQIIDSQSERLSMLALIDRVAAGNEKLIASWPKIWDIQDEEKRQRELKRWDKANRLLDALCMELMYRFDYHDCLYLDKNGYKTKPCVRQDGFCCFVCPSDIPYWRKEDEDKELASKQLSMDSFWGD
jgi:hypothetical protein